VEVERAFAREEPASLLQAWREEREIVLEGVAVGGFGEQPGGVAATLKARAIAVLMGERAGGLPLPESYALRAALKRGLDELEAELTGKGKR